MILELCAAVLLSAAPRSITLEQVREESRGNLEVLNAELEQARSAEQSRAARSFIYPHLSAGAGGGNGFLPNHDPAADPDVMTATSDQTALSRYNADFTVTQLVYDGGKWWNRIAQADSTAKAAEGKAAEQRLASELEGVRRFYELLRAQKTLEVLGASIKRSEQQLDRARALFEAGRGQKGDAYAAQVNLGNDRLEVVRQRARLVDAQTKLAAWVARDGVTPLVAETPVEFEAKPSVSPTVEEALSAAHSARPLLRSLSDQVRAAGLGVDVARGEFLPQISLTGTAGRQGPTVDPVFTDPTRQNYVRGGIELRWDLFSGFSTDSQLEQANLSRKLANAQLTQAERNLEGEIRTCVVLLQTQLESAEISDSNAKVARESLQLAEERFKAGAGSTLEVRDAQLKLTQAELQLLQHRIDVEIARAALSRAVGTGAGT